MMAPPQHTLPLSTTSALTPVSGARAAASAPAWQAEMQRAQGALAPGQPLRPVAEVPTPVTGARALSTTHATPVKWAPARVWPAGCEPPQRETPVAARTRQGDLPLQPGNPLNAAAKDAEGVPACERAPRRIPRVALSPAQEVRIHVERQGSGLAVWLAIRASAGNAAGRAVAALAELQRHPEIAAHPVHRLVCNGTTVYTADPAKENP